MICPKCGIESSGNYCSNCGAPLKNNGNDDGRDDFWESEQTGDEEESGFEFGDRIYERLEENLGETWAGRNMIMVIREEMNQ